VGNTTCWVGRSPAKSTGNVRDFDSIWIVVTGHVVLNASVVSLEIVRSPCVHVLFSVSEVSAVNRLRCDLQTNSASFHFMML